MPYRQRDDGLHAKGTQRQTWQTDKTDKRTQDRQIHKTDRQDRRDTQTDTRQRGRQNKNRQTVSDWQTDGQCVTRAGTYTDTTRKTTGYTQRTDGDRQTDTDRQAMPYMRRNAYRFQTDTETHTSRSTKSKHNSENHNYKSASQLNISLFLWYTPSFGWRGFGHKWSWMNWNGII